MIVDNDAGRIADAARFLRLLLIAKKKQQWGAVQAVPDPPDRAQDKRLVRLALRIARAILEGDPLPPDARSDADEDSLRRRPGPDQRDLFSKIHAMRGLKAMQSYARSMRTAQWSAQRCMEATIMLSGNVKSNLLGDLDGWLGRIVAACREANRGFADLHQVYERLGVREATKPGDDARRKFLERFKKRRREK